MASVTDTIFHLLPSNGVAVNRFEVGAEKSLAGAEAFPGAFGAFGAFGVLHTSDISLPGAMTVLSSSLAVTLPASHQQSSAAALSTPLCFSLQLCSVLSLAPCTTAR
jgi:hypothetical protein